MKTLSPLRYPGGKTQMYGLVKEILKKNDMLGQVYVEPFAGGAGLALKLLMKGDVKSIILNELDPYIYSFWYSVLHYPKELCKYILDIDVDLETWHQNKQTYLISQNDIKVEELDYLRVAKIALFLNRTNFSGIFFAGHMDNIDCRFNRGELINKILKINKFKSQINLYCLDGVELINKLYLYCMDDLFINCDPPYVEKGEQLYKYYFTEEDHKRLATVLSRTENKWICTYDVNPLAEELYKDYRKDYVDIRYSVANPEKAKELIIYSNNLIV